MDAAETLGNQKPVTAAPLTMTFTIKPPEPLNFAKPQEWEKQIARSERFRLASNPKNSYDANQDNPLEYRIRGEADNVLRGPELTTEQHREYDTVK